MKGARGQDVLEHLWAFDPSCCGITQPSSKLNRLNTAIWTVDRGVYWRTPKKYLITKGVKMIT